MQAILDLLYTLVPATKIPLSASDCLTTDPCSEYEESTDPEESVLDQSALDEVLIHLMSRIQMIIVTS